MKTITNTSIQREETAPNTAFPSADLIKYRFDSIDMNLGKLDSKLEQMNGMIVTPKDMAEAKVESAAIHLSLRKDIEELKNNSRWWFRAIISAILLAVCSLTLTLLVKGPVK